jgi:5-methylcytosine-specific restriction endonuclease McrA
MKNHVKIYFEYFGYDKNSFIECEICGAKAVDLHHIERRGMGGSKSADRIENIMALCRKCHDSKGDRKEWKEWLIKLHNIKLKK